MNQIHDTPAVHLWSDEKRVEASELIAELKGHPGWALLVEAVESHKSQVSLQLETQRGDVAADYANLIGEIRGLGSLLKTADLTIQAGAKAADRLKEKMA